VTRDSPRGRWQRVLEARRQARQALGQDPEQVDLFDAPPQKKSSLPYVPATPPTPLPRSEAIGVLTLGEAAVRLGLTRAELEAMIAAGKVETLPGEFTRFVPSAEVDRLTRQRT
jgi:hypothetical protein